MLNKIKSFTVWNKKQKGENKKIKRERLEQLLQLTLDLYKENKKSCFPSLQLILVILHADPLFLMLAYTLLYWTSSILVKIISAFVMYFLR